VSVLDAIRDAREGGDLRAITAAVPYHAFMGMDMEVVGGRVRGTMRFDEHLIGNYAVRALHGGTLGALLEATAAITVICETECVRLPRVVNLTVEYLRGGKAEDTFAEATLTKQGRRIACVRAVAWQDDPERPIAAANAQFLLT